jgi:5-aminopentanamidase
MARPVTLSMVNVTPTVVGIEERRRDLLALVDRAGAAGAQIVLLPECCDHHRTHEANAAYKARSPDAVRRACGVTLSSPWMSALSALAVKHRMVVIPDVMLADGARWYNSCVVFGPDGSVLGQYRKTHLAPTEETIFTAGDRIEPITTPFGRVGLIICYDRNFPEVGRCHEVQGADLLLWTTMRHAELDEGLYRATLPGMAITHGLPLCVATYAMETHARDRATFGSAIYNVFGQVVAGGLATTGLVTGTVDLDVKLTERRSWDEPDEWLDSPRYLRAQRRPELYAALVAPVAEKPKDVPALTRTSSGKAAGG